jgi:hypothetical protein
MISTHHDEVCPREVLNNCVGTIQALRLQVEQMRGLFDDSDGTIAEALEAADIAQAQACEFLQRI